jgi:hypothetical protein
MNEKLMDIAKGLGIATEYKTIRLNGEVTKVEDRVSAEHQKILEAAYKAGMLAEREACAKLCDDLDKKWNLAGFKTFAAAIRGRT